MTVDRDFALLLNGFGKTTAEILYRLPDHPLLLQSYVWQDYDTHPRFPQLCKFTLPRPLAARAAHASMRRWQQNTYAALTTQRYSYST